jgi:phospholipid-binding lipoprotein MlaA
MKFAMRCVAAAAVAAAVAGCAQVPTDPEERAEFEATNDPWEPTNRAIFDFNMALDENVGEPVARTYHDNVPDRVQKSLHNALNNLKTPWIFANDILQGEPKRAADTLGRFMLNTTWGLGGLFDVAGEDNGPKFHDEDFGQTLAVWGVGEGPYMMLPFFGPSNPRDAFGKGAEMVGDPTDIMLNAAAGVAATATRSATGIVDDRSQLLDPVAELKRSSLDFYAAVRSAYRQKRASDIANKDLPPSEIYKAQGVK